MYGEFQDGEDWEDYVEQFDQYCLANDIEDTVERQRKRAAFLSVVGKKTYKLYKTLLAPLKPTDKSYPELCELMHSHVTPKPVVIAERYTFYNRKQRAGESVT